MGLGCVLGHTGSLVHGDSEGALFEEGAQAGVGDRTKALVAAPVCAVEEVGKLGLSERTHAACRGGVWEGFRVLPPGQ